MSAQISVATAIVPAVPKSVPTKLRLVRGQYAEVLGYGNADLSVAVSQAREILNAAVRSGALPAEFCEVDRRHRGSALTYDLYDVEVRRGKVVAALYQHRLTTCSKYGNSPTKDYLILRKGRAKVPLIEWLDDARKLRVVRMSRHSLLAGEVIEVLGRHGSQPGSDHGGEQ